MIQQHLLNIEVNNYKKGSPIPRNPTVMQTDFSLSKQKKTLAFLLKDTIKHTKWGCDRDLPHTDFTLVSPQKVEKFISTEELEKACSVYLTPSHIELNTKDALYKTFNVKDFYIRVDSILGEGYPYPEVILPPTTISTGVPIVEFTTQLPPAKPVTVVTKGSDQKQKIQSIRLLPSHTFDVKKCESDGDVFVPREVRKMFEEKNMAECVVYRTNDGGYNILTEENREQVLAYIKAGDKTFSEVERRKKMSAFRHNRSSSAYIVGDYIIPTTAIMKEHIRTSKDFTVQVYC